MSAAKTHQTGTTYGNAWMFRTLVRLLRAVDTRVVYVFMYIFVIPLQMPFSRGTRLAYRYFRRRRGYGRLKSAWSTYRNHCLFGETVIDKFAMYAGRHFTIRMNGEQAYRQLLAGKEPLIQLGAHIGCSEILGYSYPMTKPLNMLVFGGEKQQLMSLRSESFGKMNIRMIPVGVEASHAQEISDALERGEVVSAFADRVMNPRKVVVSKIHGHAVRLAKGPFSIAATRGCKVVMVSAMKERDGSYSACFTPLSYDRSLPLAEQRQQLADAYTREIERLLEKYPLQWFNYFDLWQDEA